MNRTASAVAALTVLWGWRRLVVAGMAGAAAALALAPHYMLPALFVSLPVLVWLLDGVAETRPGGRRLGVHLQAFAVGWSFGFGHHLAGLYWVGRAFLVDADAHGWMLPFAVVLLPAGLAVFTGLATVLARLAWRPGFFRILALAAAWTIMEAGRATLLTGFPWNQLGQAFALSDELMQGAAYVGGLGLTFLAVAAGAAPASLADAAGPLRGGRGAALAVLVLAAAWGLGAWRLSAAAGGDIADVRVRIVQPSIDQASKWDPDKKTSIVATYLELSDVATSPETMGVEGVTHLIWPETALPLLLEPESEVVAAIAALLPPETVLVTGGLRVEPDPSGRRRVFNSVLALDSDGRRLGAYDKQRLVPFGEFLPFQSQLEAVGVTQLTNFQGGFAAGTGERILSAGSGPAFVPLICYEVIFSDPPVRVGGEAEPGWILNVTNDAWFGDSGGPHQHLVQARLRAVETGLPVVRAANTGISAIIDPYGRLQNSLSIGRKGVLDSRIPAGIAPPLSARAGSLPVIVVLLLVFLGILFWKYSSLQVDECDRA